MFEKEIQNIKQNILAITQKAGSGHPTSSLSCMHILIYLFFSGVYKTDWNDWNNSNYDQFILSKGHATPILYSIYFELGLVSQHDLDNYRQLNGVLEGHPTPKSGFTKVTSGSLGMGISIGCGIALGNKLKNNNSKTYILCGDSELAEGSNWEGINFAVENNLRNLIILVDVNGLGQRGETMEKGDLDKISKKFEGFGINVIKCENGHDFYEIQKSFKNLNTNRPNVILFKTIKGWGINNIAGKNNWHGKVVPAELIS